MNRKIVRVDENRGGKQTKIDLAAPSDSRDVCLAAESGRSSRPKRKTFKINIMAKGTKTRERTRPVRKIKLNRNIFNTGFQGKPTFHVKTLDELKCERQESKETSTVSTKPKYDDICNHGCINSTTTVVCASQTASQVVSVDTRKVIKVDTPKKLMLPTIQLTRIGSGKHISRSVNRISTPGNVRRIIRSEAALRRFKSFQMQEDPSVYDSDTISHPQQQSQAKKRRISPIRLPESESTPTLANQQSIIEPWSTDLNVLDVPSSLERPPLSPTLSLGAQSDEDLHGDIKPALPIPDERVVISSRNTPILDMGQMCNTWAKPVRQQSSVSPLKKWSNLLNSSFSPVDTSFDNDKLDIMSIWADDDELLVEENPKPLLTRSLSQDSVFKMSNNQEDRGDLRSLLKKTNDAQSNITNTAGELISTKPLPFKIPFSHQNGGNAGFFASPRTNIVSAVPPQGPLQVNASVNYRSGMGVTQGLSHSRPDPKTFVDRIKISLRQRNVGEAWAGIKKVNQMNCAIDKRLLEEMLKVCERISDSSPSPVLGDAALGSFEIIKRLGDVNPTDYIMTIMSLCRCQRIHSALSTFKDMIASRKLPSDDLLERFVKDLCKALVFAPGKIIEVVQDVLTFPFTPRRKANIVNSCISFLISAQRNKLREINTDVWNNLLTLLCNPPASNVQSAAQVSTLMEQNGVPLSPAAILLLLKLYQETTSIKLLLNLLNSQATKDILNKHKLPNDIAHFMLSPKVDIWEIESCFAGMIKDRTMPAAELLEPFIQKASLAKDYDLIYQFFVKCKKSTLSLPLSVLKQMMDVLDNWDENTDASVQVYAALRQARKADKQPSNMVELAKNPDRLTNGGQKAPVDCLHFTHTGSCHYGDMCNFAHVPNNRRRSSSHDSEHLERGSTRESQSGEDVGKSGDGSNQLNSNALSPGSKPGVLGEPPVVNNLLLNNVKPLMSNPFAALQVLNSGFAPQIFNTQLYNKVHSTRPPSKLHSQRNNRMPKFGARGRNQPFPRHPSPSIPKHHVVPPSSHKHPVLAHVSNHSPSSHKRMVPHASNPPPSSHKHPVVPRVSNHSPSSHKHVVPHASNHPPSSHKHPVVPHVSNHSPSSHKHEVSHASNPPPSSHKHSEVPHASNRAPSSHPVDKQKVTRSFSWEPATSGHSGVKPARHNSWEPHRSPGIKHSMEKNNNNDKVIPDKQLCIEMAIRLKDWQSVHASYVESKGSIDIQSVKRKDLLLFRNGFVKDPAIGKNFGAFVDFLYKENNSGRSCHSSNSHPDVFDQYDIEFIGSLGVSLMEKCLVLKQFEEGYEVLLSLHSHNISYFQSGLNFGAYTKDIPPTNIALIAVKLCLGVANHGTLGAMVVLRACDYALAEEGEVLHPDDVDYRVRVLHQLFVQLFDEGHVAESYEVIQNLNASPIVTGPVYNKVFDHYVTQDDFDQSFVVLDEMQEKGLDFNGPMCDLLYEKFLKHCVELKKYDEGIVVVGEMESKGISIRGRVFRDILNMLTSVEQEMLAMVLFEKCSDLAIYPKTFCNDTPWLCELGCDYSQVELKLLIQKHLKQVHHYLLTVVSDELITAVKDLEIVLFPRLSTESGLRIANGIQKTLANVTSLVEKILQQEFNPPLAILQLSGEQFHKKILVEKMSVYRWFNANNPSMQGIVESQEDEALSQVSLESDLSDLGEIS